MISKHSTIPVPDCLYAARKISFDFHFDTSFILDDVKLAELSNKIRVNECDVLGVKTYSDASSILSGG